MGAGIVGYTERRLAVWFDERDVVTKATFDQKACPRAGIAPGGESGPCLRWTQGDGSINRAPGLEAQAPVVARFDDVYWRTPPLEHGKLDAPPNYAVHRGSLLVTSEALIASGKDLIQDAPGYLRIEFRDVADLARDRVAYRRDAIVLTTNGGAGYEFEVAESGIASGRDDTERLIKVLEKGMQRPARLR